jgi:hypothetical protein
MRILKLEEFVAELNDEDLVCEVNEIVTMGLLGLSGFYLKKNGDIYSVNSTTNLPVFQKNDSFRLTLYEGRGRDYFDKEAKWKSYKELKPLFRREERKMDEDWLVR